MTEEFQPPADSGIDFERAFQPVEGSTEIDFDAAMNDFEVVDDVAVQDRHPDAADDETLAEPERDFDAEASRVESQSE